MCENYDYIALSTMETPKQGVYIHYDDKMLKNLCRIAHRYGCKVHGLGYMSLKELNNPNIYFDTIDASSWNGSIWGYLFEYKHGNIKRTKAPKKLTSKQISRKCYDIWVKICREKGEL